MGGIKLSVHPLFFALGFYFALTGRIFVFLTCTVCAVIHELGHSFVSAKLGYRLNKITLMPFGAVVSGATDDMSALDEIKIALVGPIVNLAVGLFFVALWWIFPTLYAYTDIAVESCFSMAIVNLIPVFPLDGGRVSFALLRSKFKLKTAQKICKISGFVFSGLILGLFIFTLFYTPNFTLLFFALFSVFGVLGMKKENAYVRLFCGIDENRLLKGVKINRIAIDKRATVKTLISLLDTSLINEVEVYEGGEKICTLSQKNLQKIAKNGELYSPVGKYL